MAWRALFEVSEQRGSVADHADFAESGKPFIGGNLHHGQIAPLRPDDNRFDLTDTHACPLSRTALPGAEQ